jgi:hypothetical protein
LPGHSRRKQSAKYKSTDADFLLRFAKNSLSQPPAGFIFHLSRCGSTLISQMLATDPANLVLVEPRPLEALLATPEPSSTKKLALISGAIESYQASLIGRERRLFVKLGGNTHWLPLLTELFPKTPWVYVYRDPYEVIASNLREPPDWLNKVADLSFRKQMLVDHLNQHFTKVLESQSAPAGLINYKEINRHFAPRLLRLFTLKPDLVRIDAMNAVRSRYSKDLKIDWSSFKQKRSLVRDVHDLKSYENQTFRASMNQVLDQYQRLEQFRKSTHQFLKRPANAQ